MKMHSRIDKSVSATQGRTCSCIVGVFISVPFNNRNALSYYCVPNSKEGKWRQIHFPSSLNICSKLEVPPIISKMPQITNKQINRNIKIILGLNNSKSKSHTAAVLQDHKSERASTLIPPQVRLCGSLQWRWWVFAHVGKVLRENRAISDHLHRRPAPHQVCLRLRDPRGGILCSLWGLQDRCVVSNRTAVMSLLYLLSSSKSMSWMALLFYINP